MNRGWIRLTGRIAFSVSWALVTLNVSQTQGLFVYPLLFHVTIGTSRYPVGAILLIPFVAAVATPVGARASGARAGWRPGRWAMTVPVVALGLLALVRSWPIHATAVAIPSVVAILLFWGVYATTLHTWPQIWLAATLGGLALINGTVALAQFARQGSLGLAFLGELPLDPQVRGASVVEVAGQRWLRAYGLLPHPNVLGGVLGVALLICLGMLLQERERHPRAYSRMISRMTGRSLGSQKNLRIWGGGARGWLWAATVMAAGGLLVSFSRSAWLGTGLGLLYLAGAARLWRHVAWRARGTRWLLAGAAVVVLVTGAAFGRLMVARLGRASSPLEQASINERVRDFGQAWMLIRHLPLRGVGTGYYVDALWAWAGATGQDFPAFQDVHNVPLLVGAELGVFGTGLWLWLVSLPVIAVVWAARKGPVDPARAALGAAFLLVWVAGMLDSYPYILHFRSAALLGALCGVWAQTPPEVPVDEP